MDGRILIVKHVEKEGPGLIETFFRDDGWDLETVELGLGEKLPDSLDGLAAAIFLGGPMNVYEVKDHPFLDAEENFIRRLLIEEVPMLGICLGGQLLAKTCGARVKKAAHKEVGWYSLRLTREGLKDSVFAGASREFKVFEWHEDTFDMPADGVLLVRGKTCRNQAFRVGRNAYGLQFHLEVTDSMVREWMKDEEGMVDTGAILSDTQSLKHEFEAETRRFLQNFRGLIESSVRVKKIMKLFVEDEKKTKKKSIPWWNAGKRTRSPAKGLKKPLDNG